MPAAACEDVAYPHSSLSPASRSPVIASCANNQYGALQMTTCPALTKLEMPALDSLAIATQKQFLERRNWANRNRGPVLVFVIVFIVAMGIAMLVAYRAWMRRKASRANYARIYALQLLGLFQTSHKGRDYDTLNLTNTSVGNNSGRHIRNAISVNQAVRVLRKLSQDLLIRQRGPVARIRLAVPFTDVPKVSNASTGGVDGWHIVHQCAARQRGIGNRGRHRVKVVALEQNPGVGVNVKGMAANVLEIVVHPVEENAAVGVGGSQVRCAAGNIVEPVTLEGVPVLFADEQQSPVVLPIASGGPVSHAVEFVVRDGNVASGAPARHDELATGKRELVVVDPDPVAVVEGEEVSSPHVLRVCIGEVDVLDDDVAGAAADAQALAADDAGAADTDDTLVAADVERRLAGVVIGAADPSPVVAGVDNPGLAGAGAASAGRCALAAALAGCRALGADEAPFAVDENDTGGVVGDPFDKSATSARVARGKKGTY
ncbi:uncharacterized protein DSM5745_05703 [Aspergillus mulundensis]|uniref:Uncharacterized protein n=1 Tax=Aspergillus mulundensis TaxID=1810919 RepID=A0A3D8RYF2_9EURO|nr:hypothetical protein DSM5745_05703 [Aspergillus mulundensis]RDW78851.1 hypothetical protein DSM5745_05703 [Aspergillus mulundensis]